MTTSRRPPRAPTGKELLPDPDQISLEKACLAHHRATFILMNKTQDKPAQAASHTSTLGPQEATRPAGLTWTTPMPEASRKLIRQVLNEGSPTPRARAGRPMDRSAVPPLLARKEPCNTKAGGQMTPASSSAAGHGQTTRDSSHAGAKKPLASASPVPLAKPFAWLARPPGPWPAGRNRVGVAGHCAWPAIIQGLPASASCASTAWDPPERVRRSDHGLRHAGHIAHRPC